MIEYQDFVGLIEKSIKENWLSPTTRAAHYNFTMLQERLRNSTYSLKMQVLSLVTT